MVVWLFTQFLSFLAFSAKFKLSFWPRPFLNELTIFSVCKYSSSVTNGRTESKYLSSVESSEGKGSEGSILSTLNVDSFSSFFLNRD